MTPVSPVTLDCVWLVRESETLSKMTLKGGLALTLEEAALAATY